ncbi:MAG: hypothetical protein IKN45_04340 [Lachnospiraceae bacterium]|nr:hypothetical protein [Lachnospiraceae bacterium]
MEINDLVWTRLDGRYYLCRVTDLWKNRKPNKEHDVYDIGNYVKVEWLDIGMEQDVPGKVLSSFRPAATAQSINGVEDISMYLWDKYSEKKVYNVAAKNIDFWTVLSAEAIEEIVLLYLQVVKEYHIYSSTVKYAFDTYECLLVNNKGKRCYPQVKSGDVSLNANDYVKALDFDPDADIYLFAVSERYKDNGCNNIKYIYKKELEDFIKQHRNLLPRLTYHWIDLCGFFE